MQIISKNNFLYMSVFILAFFGFIMVVFAGTSSAVPTSDGTYKQWNPTSGTHYTRVDESTCNGTTDYVYTTTTGTRDSYYIAPLGTYVPNWSTITDIAITPCASKNSNGGRNSVMNVFYRFDGTDSADAGNYSLIGTTPVELSATTFSGLSHLKTPSSTLQIGGVFTSGSKGARLSRMGVTITYTLPVAPAAPSDLVASENTGTSSPSVLLNWVDNSSNEDNFKVERGTDGVNFSQIGTTGTNVATYTDNTVSSGTTYYYQVRASNAGGNSGYSNVASVSIP